MMSEKDYKKLLLKAYIEGKEDELIWGLDWEKLPWIGKYRRIKTFLKWYNLNIENNRYFKLKKINNKLYRDDRDIDKFYNVEDQWYGKKEVQKMVEKLKESKRKEGMYIILMMTTFIVGLLVGLFI